MAHQAHTLPWNTLASNFQYKTTYHSGRPYGVKDIFALGKPNQEREVKYFGQALAKRIQEFTASERAKYGSAESYKRRAASWTRSDRQKPNRQQTAGRGSQPAFVKKSEDQHQETRLVISDELVRRYSDSKNYSCHTYFLDRHHSSQTIEEWLKPHYQWVLGVDIVDILMLEASAVAPALSAETNSREDSRSKSRESMETLLLMANHPRLDFLSLKYMCWGHHTGFCRLAEQAVQSYIYMGVLLTLQENGSEVCDIIPADELDPTKEDPAHCCRRYMRCPSYQQLLSYLIGSYDGCANTFVHRDFFIAPEGCGPLFEGAPQYCPGSQRDVFADITAIREYLKGLWRLMVTFDVIIGDAGDQFDWERESWNTLSFFGVPRR